MNDKANDLVQLAINVTEELLLLYIRMSYWLTLAKEFGGCFQISSVELL